MDWAYIVAIVAILCGAVISIDKHHANNRNNDDLKQRVDKLETEVSQLKTNLNNK